MPVFLRPLQPIFCSWPATYSCTGPRWWSHRSQCWCFPGSGCRSSDGSRAGRTPWHSGGSGGCWCCSSAQGSTGLQEWGRQALRWQASGSSGAQDGQDTLIPAPKPLPEPSLAWPHQSLRPGEKELDRAATTVPILFFRARSSAEPAQKPVCGVEGEVPPAL